MNLWIPPRGASALLASVAAGAAWVDGRTLVRIYTVAMVSASRVARGDVWPQLALVAALALNPEVQDLVSRLTGQG